MGVLALAYGNDSTTSAMQDDGTRTTQFNDQIEFEFCDKEYSFKSGQTAMQKTIDFEETIDGSWFGIVMSYASSGTICFDLLVTLKKSDIKISKSKISVYLDSCEDISVKGANSPVKWKSSNKIIAVVYSEEDDKKSYGTKATIYPRKKKGSCYIYATCQGKTVKCKVTVKGRKNIQLVGSIDSYNTRNNTFYLNFINFSDKKVKLCKTGATALDSDYTAFDRKLKLKKSVTIQSGKKKRVAFKVIGKNTWWDIKDFCVNYSVIYRGKKYRLASDTEYTWRRKKGKWKKLGDYDFNY